MNGPEDHRSGTMSRRSFVRTLAVLSVAPTLLIPRRSLAAALQPRKLAFRHLHTDEQLSLVYFADGGYLPDSLVEVNRLLRDHRTGETHEIDPKLLDFLHAAIAGTSSKGIYEVICGYRSPATNEILRARGNGVAKKSLHLTGKAIDVRLADIDTARLRDRAVALGRGGVGYYPRSNFVHLDTGRARTW